MKITEIPIVKVETNRFADKDGVYQNQYVSDVYAVTEPSQKVRFQLRSNRKPKVGDYVVLPPAYEIKVSGKGTRFLPDAKLYKDSEAFTAEREQKSA
jgi:hypothetical protein